MVLYLGEEMCRAKPCYDRLRVNSQCGGSLQLCIWYVKSRRTVSTSDGRSFGRCFPGVAGHLKVSCEGLVLGYLESLDVVQAANKDKGSSKLVDSPGRILLSNACKVLASEMTGSVDTSTVLDGPEDKRTEVELKKSEKAGNTLDEVIETMDPEITDRVIATLVFHWTTLDKFNGFTRVQVRV